MAHQKQVLYLAKVGAAIFFDHHPYIVAPIGATDNYIKQESAMLQPQAHHPLGNFVAATLETSKESFMKLIMTMIFMKIPLKFQVLLQQSCLVAGGLQAYRP